MSASSSQTADHSLDSFGDAAASATRVTPGNALRPEDIALQDTAPSTEAVAQYALRLGDLLRKGESQANVMLMPGDVIIIPESMF